MITTLALLPLKRGHRFFRNSHMRRGRASGAAMPHPSAQILPRSLPRNFPDVWDFMVRAIGFKDRASTKIEP